MLSQTPGTAVMISHNAPRYTQSVQCFEALQLPDGSKKEHFASGLDLALARERIAETLKGDWLFFIDDDHLHQPDLAMRLLRRLDEHPDLDVVASFVVRRWPPYYTVAGKLNDDGTASIQQFERGHGLARVDLSGLGGGAVIRRSAFATFTQPWFTGGRFTEDWTFCSRLKAAGGGKVAVDLESRVGHITPMSIWPTLQEDGTWGVAYLPVRDGSQAWTLQCADAGVGQELATV